ARVEHRELAQLVGLALGGRRAGGRLQAAAGHVVALALLLGGEEGAVFTDAPAARHLHAGRAVPGEAERGLAVAGAGHVPGGAVQVLARPRMEDGGAGPHRFALAVVRVAVTAALRIVLDGRAAFGRRLAGAPQARAALRPLRVHA